MKPRSMVRQRSSNGEKDQQLPTIRSLLPPRLQHTLDETNSMHFQLKKKQSTDQYFEEVLYRANQEAMNAKGRASADWDELAREDARRSAALYQTSSESRLVHGAVRRAIGTHPGSPGKKNVQSPFMGAAHRNSAVVGGSSVMRKTKYTKADEEGALKKLADAAASMADPSDAVNALRGVDSAGLKLGELKDVLKRTLGLQLSRRELSALFDRFDKNGDGRLDYSEFIHAFLRLSYEDHEVRQKELRSMNGAASLRREKRLEHRSAEKNSRGALQAREAAAAASAARNDAVSTMARARGIVFGWDSEAIKAIKGELKKEAPPPVLGRSKRKLRRASSRGQTDAIFKSQICLQRGNAFSAVNKPIKDLSDREASLLNIVDGVAKSLKRRIDGPKSKYGGSWFKLFVEIDSDSDGSIEYWELRKAVRNVLKIPKKRLSDKFLGIIWCLLDNDGSGSTTVQEFTEFVRRRTTGQPEPVDLSQFTYLLDAPAPPPPPPKKSLASGAAALPLVPINGRDVEARLAAVKSVTTRKLKHTGSTMIRCTTPAGAGRSARPREVANQNRKNALRYDLKWPSVRDLLSAMRAWPDISVPRSMLVRKLAEADKEIEIGPQTVPRFTFVSAVQTVLPPPAVAEACVQRLYSALDADATDELWLAEYEALLYLLTQPRSAFTDLVSAAGVMRAIFRMGVAHTSAPPAKVDHFAAAMSGASIGETGSGTGVSSIPRENVLRLFDAMAPSIEACESLRHLLSAALVRAVVHTQVALVPGRRGHEVAIDPETFDEALRRAPEAVARFAQHCLEAQDLVTMARGAKKPSWWGKHNS